ncbi:helix-turn-helix domain-containing protein, partial [Siphonobacter sp.]|uniref:helix-turn-helix domain-containing protein n=1 Tax=Siphonobacter sp. TaxID=1869184 RepID=UPI003B3B4BDE
MSSNIEVQKVCEHCGKVFTARTTKTRYCSHTCNSKAYKAGVRVQKIQLTVNQPKKESGLNLEDIKAKEFMTVKDAAKLLNSSVRTIYRLIDEGTLKATNLGERKTTIKRSEIDKLFTRPAPIAIQEPTIQELDSDEPSYTLAEVRSKYGISDKALYEVIKRNQVPKLQKGRVVHVSKLAIDQILNP